MRVRNSRRDMPGLGALPMSRKDGLARAWNDAGLVDIEVDSLTIRMDYGSISGRRSTARRGLLPNTLAPAETKLALRNLAEAAYLDGEPDGPRSYAATAWAVKGWVPWPVKPGHTITVQPLHRVHPSPLHAPTRQSRKIEEAQRPIARQKGRTAAHGARG